MIFVEAVCPVSRKDGLGCKTIIDNTSSAIPCSDVICRKPGGEHIERGGAWDIRLGFFLGPTRLPNYVIPERACRSNTATVQDTFPPKYSKTYMDERQPLGERRFRSRPTAPCSALAASRSSGLVPLRNSCAYTPLATSGARLSLIDHIVPTMPS